MASGDSNDLSRAIPAGVRRVALQDLSQLPNDYSTTPGGTMFSTTPGGTRIVYDRNFLLHCRNSPLAKSPPGNLPDIPGVTSPLKGSKENGPSPLTTTSPAITPRPEGQAKKPGEEEPQFEMDI